MKNCAWREEPKEFLEINTDKIYFYEQLVSSMDLWLTLAINCREIQDNLHAQECLQEIILSYEILPVNDRLICFSQ